MTFVIKMSGKKVTFVIKMSNTYMDTYMDTKVKARTPEFPT
jgi:hypothetical protein